MSISIKCCLVHWSNKTNLALEPLYIRRPWTAPTCATPVFWLIPWTNDTSFIHHHHRHNSPFLALAFTRILPKKHRSLAATLQFLTLIARKSSSSSLIFSLVFYIFFSFKNIFWWLKVSLYPFCYIFLRSYTWIFFY